MKNKLNFKKILTRICIFAFLTGTTAAPLATNAEITTNHPTTISQIYQPCVDGDPKPG